MTLINILLLCAIALPISIFECTSVWKRDYSELEEIELSLRSQCPSRCQVCCGGFIPGVCNCCNCRCFPSVATVTLKNGKSVTMLELQVGDYVQTVSSSGSITYSKVTTFLNNENTVMSLYISFQTSTNKTVNLSGNHLIYVRQSYGEKFYPIFANQVAVDDEVLVHEFDEINPAKFINVSSSLMQGAHVPLTTEGKLMVHGVLASCYPSIHHDLAHFGMSPLQLFPKLISKMFGEDNGLSTFVNIAADLGGWMIPNGQKYGEN